MLLKKIPFTDFDGNEREEDFYFHLTKAELLDWTTSIAGGLDKHLDRIMKAKDTPEIMKEFKNIIDKSYGVKTPDGRGFMKTPELLAAFKATNAYSELYVELATNSEAASAFINGIMPKALLDEVEKERAKTEQNKVVEMKN